MGTTHSYMANGSGQDMYVMASLNPDWAIVDFIVDVVPLLNGIEEIQACTAAELPETLVTIRDLYEFLKMVATLIAASVASGSRPGEAVLALQEAFKKTTVKIPNGEYKDVHENGVLSLYLSADGVASFAGAGTVSLLVLSGDGRQLAMWNTGADDSWIGTGDKKIVRSKYGTIWQQDPSAGTVDWPVRE